MLSHPQLFFKEINQYCSVEDHKPLSFVIMKFIYCMSTTVENIERYFFVHEIVLYILSILEYKYCALSEVHKTFYVLCVKPVTTC